MSGNAATTTDRGTPTYLDVSRTLLSATCALLPLVLRHDATIFTLAALSAALLAQRWFPGWTVVGGLALVAELALALHRARSGLDLSAAAVDGVLLIAVSGLTHPTGHRQDLAADIFKAAPAIGVAVVAALLTPSLGTGGLLAGCIAAGVLIFATSPHVAWYRAETRIDLEDSHTDD